MRSYATTALLGTLLLAACAGEAGHPTEPGDTPPEDLAAHAFRLDLDLQSGRVQVTAPRPSAQAMSGARSLSLIGSDGVDARSTSDLTCVPLPGTPKLKRCAFTLEVANRLSVTDLVTPTDFPKPPPGTEGVLVFPLTATAAAAGPLGDALPSPDWDRPAINLFNDFAGCNSGGKSDCYRYELYPSPLYAKQSAGRRVGYDVPASATTISAYIVVAAALRDNPVQTLTLHATATLCGYAREDGVFLDQYLRVDDAEGSFCSFSTALNDNYLISKATLRFYRLSQGGSHAIFVDALDFGDALDETDVNIPVTAEVGTLGTTGYLPEIAERDWLEVDATASVRAAIADHQNRLQYRLRCPGCAEVSEFSNFASPRALETADPELVVQFRAR